MNTSNLIKLSLSLVLPLAVGAIAGLATADAVPGWYATLNRPAISPPNWVFGPVWTILYLLMGISLFLVWKQPAGTLRTYALAAFALQLLLNFCWTFLFFYFKRMGIALVEIIILWVCIAAMLFIFYRVRPVAAYLNIPYLLWVSFATALNASYYALN